MRGVYFENPGTPTEEERGTYCPDGVKIAEFPPGQPELATVIQPWQCSKPWCTENLFRQMQDEMEAELAEADKHAAGCVLGPGHEEPCGGQTRPEHL